jgi:Zn-dependent protease with chaperone function
MAFDPKATTVQYIDSLGAANLDKAHHYTVGGHWLLLWGLAVSAIITSVIVRWGILDRLDRRIGQRRQNLRAFLVSGVFILLSTVISLPWTIYEGWWREKSYGRTSQPLADFLGQAVLAAAISTLIAAVFMIGVYWLMRRTGKRWWLWSGGLAGIALAAAMLLAPILIEPMFNKYEPVPPGQVRDALVSMAGRAGIPPDKIYMYNGSRQSNNFTANVSGIGSSARVAISDVAFKTASLDEVRAVTGHEIGHYVLKHIWYSVAFFAVLALFLFWLADRLFLRFARAFGTDAGIAEPRGVPVLLFLVSLFGVLALPIINTFSRMQESQADLYSLQTVNLPDALASALVKTAEYRYPRPSSVEEAIFYDHPSVERRVHTAMEWKAIHPEPPAR